MLNEGEYMEKNREKSKNAKNKRVLSVYLVVKIHFLQWETLVFISGNEFFIIFYYSDSASYKKLCKKVVKYFGSSEKCCNFALAKEKQRLHSSTE